jgi:DNA replication protein DnaC
MTREEIIKNLSGKLDDSTFERIHTFFPVQKVCPTCAGKEEYTLDGKTHKCDCVMQSLLQKHYFAANIGREYHDICLNDFIGSDRDRVVSAVENYLADFDSKFHFGLGITFAGPVGTGKTFAMSCILKELIKQGRDVYLMSFEEMITTWASAWTDKEIKLQLETRLKSVDVLGLDEIKTDNRSDSFLASGFDSIVRHRTANLLPTIITTNMAEHLMSSVFPKVSSLLSPRNQYVLLEGKDLRKDEIRFRIMELEANGERRPIC